MEEISIYQQKTYKVYLLIIWLIGVLMIIYFCLPFLKKDSGLYFSDVINNKQQVITLKESVNKSQTIINSNEALLFVTINKKQFLTKFVTYISDEDLAAKELNDSSSDKNNKRFIIVGRKKAIKPAKTSDDFFIKAAPKI